MSNATYDEGVWDGDEGDESITSPATPAAGSDANDAAAEVKFDTIEIPFSTKFKIGDLSGKTQLEFSVANRALNEHKFAYSNKSGFEDNLESLPFDLVNKVGFKNLQVTNMKGAKNLFAEFPTIRAAKHHSFASKSDTASGESTTAVGFTVAPNTMKPGSFDAKFSSNVVQHAQAYPDLNKEKLRETYGKMGAKGVAWMDMQSPLINSLSEEQESLLVPDEKNGVYVYNGDFEDLRKAEEKLLEVNDKYVAFSDLNPKKFGFTLTVPSDCVYNAKTNQYETTQPTFHELAGGVHAPTAKELAAMPAQKRSEYEKNLREFDNKYATISGTLVIEAKKLAPKKAAE